MATENRNAEAAGARSSTQIKRLAPVQGVRPGQRKIRSGKLWDGADTCDWEVIDL